MCKEISKRTNKPLDIIHKNIGATVVLLKEIHVLTNGEELPEALGKLFTSEAVKCDYLTIHGNCTYLTEEQLHTPIKCIITNCPLGAIVMPELEVMANNIDLYGNKNITSHGVKQVN